MADGPKKRTQRKSQYEGYGFGSDPEQRDWALRGGGAVEMQKYQAGEQARDQARKATRRAMRGKRRSSRGGRR